MNLSQFLKLMFKYVGDRRTQADYVLFFTRSFMRDPETKAEEEEDEKDKYNPLDRYSKKSNMLNKIFSGNRDLDPDDAAQLLRKLDRPKFDNAIISLADDKQDRLILELKGYGFDCSISDLSETCCDIYEGILEALVTGKKEVFPEDINRRRSIDEDAVPLLLEVSNKCPLCGADLIKIKKGKQLRRYKIIQIYPENLSVSQKAQFDSVQAAPRNFEAFDNRIALCEDDADLYIDDPDVDIYKELIHLKKRYKRSNELNRALNTIELQKELKTVVDQIFDLDTNEGLEELRYDVLTLDDKMKSKSSLVLKNQVQFSAVHYYYFIQNLFNDLERNKNKEATVIQEEVRSCYVHIQAAGITDQDEIFERLARWILNQLDLSDKYMNACEILVAYFIQDCEVFS